MQHDNANYTPDLKERIYHWTLGLIKCIDNMPRNRSASIIASQLMRSGTSIGANYTESQAASSKKDFANFLHHALKSANESKFWLSLLQDSGKLTPEQVTPLLNELVELANILAASLITLKKKNEK